MIPPESAYLARLRPFWKRPPPGGGRGPVPGITAGLH
jgi:hypothetical protein